MPQKKKVVKKKQLPTKIGHETVKQHFIEILLPKLVNISAMWMQKNGVGLQEYQVLRKKKIQEKKNPPKKSKDLVEQRKQVIKALKGNFGCHCNSARVLVNSLIPGLNITAKEVGVRDDRSRHEKENVLKAFELRNGLILQLHGRKGLLIVTDHDEYDDDYDLHNSGGHCMHIDTNKKQLDIESVLTDKKEIEAFLKTLKPNTMMNIMRSIANFNL